MRILVRNFSEYFVTLIILTSRVFEILLGDGAPTRIEDAKYLLYNHCYPMVQCYSLNHVQTRKFIYPSNDLLYPRWGITKIYSLLAFWIL